MIRRLSYFSLVAAALAIGTIGPAGRAAAQGNAADSLAPPPPADSLARLVAARATLERLGPTLGPSLWRGFRPDTIPTLAWLPRRGFVLFGWHGALPAGFAPLRLGAVAAGWRGVDARGIANTGTELDGRQVAQVAWNGEPPADMAALMAHEAFHVYERGAGELGAARQENTALMTAYPIFDATNERDVALEGRLLSASLRATRSSARTRAAEEFLAVREARQRRLDPELVGFEEGSELNEGRAEYVQVRTREAAGGSAALTDIVARLDTLTAADRSVRLRAYALGAGESLLLDRVAPAWKDSLAAWGGTLQDALAHAIGYRARELALREEAEKAQHADRLARAAAARVAALRARRLALRDSLLARPGVVLVLSADSIGRIGRCGFDPQNLLPAGDDVYLHTRFLAPCGGGLGGQLTTPTVEDERAGTLRSVVGPADSVRVTVAGAPAALEEGRPVTGTDVRVQAPGASVTARRARVERRGRELWLTPLRP